jgi:Domain of unknown function (DUF4402)
MLKFWSRVTFIILLPFILIYSQKTSSISVLISANLTKEQNIQLPANLIFDKINSASSPSIIKRTPDEGIRIRIAGHPDEKIVLTYSSIDINNFQWISENVGAKGIIQYTPSIECTFTNSSYKKPIPLKSGSSCILPNNDGEGLVYLWIGGKIKIADKQPAGNYSGVFKITISYE